MQQRLLQPQLLSDTLRLTTVAQDQVFTGSDLNLYYDQANTTWHKRSDWFAVAGVPRFYDGKDLRMSYVIWDEQVIPFIIVELLSLKTMKSDLGENKREPDGTPTKWEVYEQILKVPNYVVFDRYENHLKIYKLVDGQYQEQAVRDGKYCLEEMAIGLGTWQGEFQGNMRLWLRWYDIDGEWIPTGIEQEERRANAEAQRAEAEHQQRKHAERIAAQERQRADRLAARLKELGIDADEL